MSNLIVRAISGAVYSLLVLLACFGGPVTQILLASVISVFAVLEWVRFGNHKVHWTTPLLIILVIFLSIYTFSGYFEVSYLQTEISRGILVFLIGALFLNHAFRDHGEIKSLYHSSFALIYIGVPMIVLPMIAQFNGESNPWMLASVFVLIWCNDTFAYLFGSAFGKHKLFPRISPNKTWEGFIGGIVSTIGASLVFYHFFPYVSYAGWLGLALVVLVFGTLGDLFESAIKRSYGIKDSGKFMPGHGGILDRIDSLLFALPMAYFYMRIFENLN